MSTHSTETDERSLIIRTLAGDDEAFVVLVHSHQGTVYNIAYWLLYSSARVSYADMT